MLQLFDMRETGGFELASTITFVLQANRPTKCASHSPYFRSFCSSSGGKIVITKVLVETAQILVLGKVRSNMTGDSNKIFKKCKK